MISQKLEEALGTADAALMRLYDALLFVLARLILVEVTWEEVKDSKRPWKAPTKVPEQVNASQAKFRLEQQQKSSTHTDEKVKQLLTLSVALNAFIVAFARGLGSAMLIGVMAFSLTASVFLCIGTLRVRPSAEPDLSDPSIDPEEFAWAKDLILATQQEQLAHMYRVDLYRAARRWFLLAFAITPFIVALAPKPDSSSAPASVNISNVTTGGSVQKEVRPSGALNDGQLSPDSATPDTSGRVATPPASDTAPRSNVGPKQATPNPSALGDSLAKGQAP